MEHNKLNFLDLTLEIVDHKIDISIYRKPMTTDAIIHNKSNAPVSHKHAALHALAHRAAMIPMSNHNLQIELNNIRHIAQKNGYPLFLVNQIISKHIRKKQNDMFPRKQADKPNFVALNFFGNQSNKIAKIYKANGYTPAFRTTNNIRNAVFNTNKNTQQPHSIDKYNMSGIYSIKCDDCNATYIGKTSRNFRQRFNEHIKSKTSNVFQHVRQTQHRITNLESNLSILHKSNDNKMLNVLEGYEIRKATLKNETLLNDQIDLNVRAGAVIDLCCTL